MQNENETLKIFYLKNTFKCFPVHDAVAASNSYLEGPKVPFSGLDSVEFFNLLLSHRVVATHVCSF